MFDMMRRLHLRISENRGIAVDAEGAMLGPDCTLVRRGTRGYRSLAREDAAVLQDLLLGDLGDPDWLFGQCGRIARSLDRGELALAQIYGLRIPIAEFDEMRLTRLAIAAPFIKAGFNPDEPRVPKGDPRGGQWTSEGGGGEAEESGASSRPNPEAAIEQVASDHDCAQIIQQCKEECIAIYVGEMPGGLPGVGLDMVGRMRRCIRECVERHGCYNF
jgi:hypothetical protein